MTTNEPDVLAEPTPDTPKYLLVRRWVIRLLIGGILFGFCAFAAITLWILRVVDEFHREATAARRDIACTLIQPYPDSAGPGVHALRTKFGCPPYHRPAPPISSVPSSRSR